MSELESARIKDSFTELLAYFASAARGNVDEGDGYGPYRLLEGVVRSTREMERLGLSDPTLNDLAAGLVVDAMKIIKDPALARARADELLEELVDRMGSRQATSDG